MSERSSSVFAPNTACSCSGRKIVRAVALVAREAARMVEYFILVLYRWGCFQDGKNQL